MTMSPNGRCSTRGSLEWIVMRGWVRLLRENRTIQFIRKVIVTVAGQVRGG